MLYKLDSCKIAQHLGSPSIFFPEVIFDKGNSDKILLILHLWLKGIPLTPPFFCKGEGRWLCKRDGFHRLALALMSQCEMIPFWMKGECQISGVIKMPLADS